MTPVLTYRGTALYLAPGLPALVRAIYTNIADRRQYGHAWESELETGLQKREDRAQVEVGRRLGELLTYSQVMDRMGATVCFVTASPYL